MKIFIQLVIAIIVIAIYDTVVGIAYDNTQLIGVLLLLVLDNTNQLLKRNEQTN